MEIRQLISFITIVQCKSFTKAAEQLGYSQSAITVQIKNLEEELDTRLFDRIGKKTILTATGSEFLAYANVILKNVNRAKSTMRKDELSGTVTIGTIDSICVSRFPDVLAKLHILYPKINVHVTLGTPEQVLEMLDNGTVDLIYILDRPRFSEQWVKYFEQKEDIVFLCGFSNPLALKEECLFSDLIRYPFILTEKNANYRYAFDNFLAKNQISVTPFLEISDTQFIVKMLEKTDCVTLLPSFFAKDAVKNGTVSILNVSGFHTAMYSQILYHREKWITPEIKAVLKLLIE